MSIDVTVSFSESLSLTYRSAIADITPRPSQLGETLSVLAGVFPSPDVLPLFSPHGDDRERGPSLLDLELRRPFFPARRLPRNIL